jgi:hypothetical protein
MSSKYVEKGFCANTTKWKTNYNSNIKEHDYGFEYIFS